MKANQVKRGQQVIYKGSVATVIEPCINTVKIKTTNGTETVSYNQIKSYEGIN